ncbi:50S ribosomal protein L32 [bacterium]|nr:50S ribosomal protein L32 [bacterium]
MATPKKRTGKASQATRRANWKGTIPATTTCPNCKAIIPTHTVCPECGWYKDGIVTTRKKAQEVKLQNDAATKVIDAEVTEENTVKL